MVEDAVEARRGKGEMDEVLMEDLAAGAPAGHLHEAGGAVESDRDVAEPAEIQEIAPRAAAEVEERERPRPLDRRQERGAVLRDIVIPGALPERLGGDVVVGNRAGREVVEIVAGHRAEENTPSRPRQARELVATAGHTDVRQRPASEPRHFVGCAAGFTVIL